MLSFLYNGTTNSLPTIGIRKIIIFTNPPECYLEAQKEEIRVDGVIQAAPSSTSELCGDPCL